MKKYYKKMILFLAIILVLGCARQMGKPDINYTFLGKRSVGPAEDRFTFEYSIDPGHLSKIDVYVYEDNGNYLISPEYAREQAISLYEYHSMRPAKNFFSRYRVAGDYVSDLNEAIQKAFLWYIDDFKINQNKKELNNK